MNIDTAFRIGMYPLDPLPSAIIFESVAMIRESANGPCGQEYSFSTAITQNLRSVYFSGWIFLRGCSVRYISTPEYPLVRNALSLPLIGV